MAQDSHFTGFENNLVSTLDAAFYDSITGNCTHQITYARTGSYSLAVNCIGVSPSRIGWDFSSTVNSCTVQHSFMVATVPSSSCMMSFAVTASATRPGLYFNSTTGKLEVGFDGYTKTDTGVTLTAYQWYKIDFKVEWTGSVMRLTANIDEGSDLTADGDTASSNITGVRMGTVNNDTFTIYYDDVSYETGVTNFPFDDYRVFPLRIDSDGTHNAGTNVIEDDTGADIGVVTAYDKVWNFGDTANYLVQVANGSTNYAEMLPNPLNATLDNLTWDSVIAYAYWAGGGNPTCLAATVAINSDSVETGIYGTSSTPADYSVQTGGVNKATITAPTGGWSTTSLNALKFRFGYSTDANPDPYLWALGAEVRASTTGCVFPWTQNFSNSVSVSSGSLGTSHLMTAPTSYEPGDLCLLFTASDAVEHNLHTVTNFTRIHSADFGAVMDSGIWIRRYSAGDGAWGTITYTHNSACAASWGYLIIKNWKDTSPYTDWLAWLSSYDTGTNLNTADTSNLDPSGAKWTSDDTLWFSVIGADGGSTAMSAVPSGYADVYTLEGNSGFLAQYYTDFAFSLFITFRTNAAASENPGAWTASSSTRNWMGQTFAVAPVGATAPGGGGGLTIPLYIHRLNQGFS